MTDEQFTYLLASIGFGFGSIFWFLFIWLIFGDRTK